MDNTTLYALGVLMTLGILACIGGLVWLTFGQRHKNQTGPAFAEMESDLDSGSPLDEKPRSAFWNAANQVPIRDIPFTREERELARQAALALQSIADSSTEASAAPDGANTVNTQCEAIAEVPAYDYPNFDGFPCEDASFASFKESMTKHGFVIRFIMASSEVHLTYAGASLPEALRRVYSPPTEIYPANLLHDDGLRRTALWAMRKFKREERPTDLEAFPYL